MIRICLIVTALLLNAFSAKAQSVYWEVESPSGKKSHLLGTYHILGSGFLDANPEMNDAFQNADAVIVETVLDSSKLMQIAMAAMDPTSSLKAMTNEEEYALLKRIMEPLLGIPIENADQLLPMSLSAAYSVQLAARSLPQDLQYPGSPIDMYMGWKAEKEGQKVLPLEAIEKQMEILYKTQSPEEQMRDLMELLSDTAKTREMTLELLEYYQKGDLESMYDLSQDFDQTMGSMEDWLDKRNLAWMPQILPYLEEGNTFMAVGALHLPGENGLLDLLKAEGYKLRPIQ